MRAQTGAISAHCCCKYRMGDSNPQVYYGQRILNDAKAALSTVYRRFLALYGYRIGNRRSYASSILTSKKSHVSA